MISQIKSKRGGCTKKKFSLTPFANANKSGLLFKEQNCKTQKSLFLETTRNFQESAKLQSALSEHHQNRLVSPRILAIDSTTKLIFIQTTFSSQANKLEK